MPEPETLAPSWGTVSTLLEPPQALLAFIAHHLHAGAGEMHLYLDRSIPQFEQWVAGKPGVSLTICDSAYWRREHRMDRPADSRYRQVLNARHAYHCARVQWLAHLDADEFLIRVPQIQRFLADLPDKVAAVSLHNAEFVQLQGRTPKTIYDGLFRKPFASAEGPEQARIYGKASPFLHHGFSGYAIGKTLFRTGRGLSLDLHGPAPLDQWNCPGNPRRVWFPRIGLLHVDGYTRSHWEAKLKGRIAMVEDGKLDGYNPGRKRQIEAALRLTGDAPDLHWLHDATRTLTPRQLLLMLRYRRILPARLNPAAALEAEFPGVDIDLSHAAIDAALAALKAA